MSRSIQAERPTAGGNIVENKRHAISRGPGQATLAAYVSDCTACGERSLVLNCEGATTADAERWTRSAAATAGRLGYSCVTDGAGVWRCPSCRAAFAGS